MGLIPSKEAITSEVDNYETLGFFKKSKNTLAVFITVISLISLAMAETLGLEYIMFSMGFNLLLAVFIYFNHRWAMVLFCGIYLLDKVLFIISQTGYPISQIIFGAIALVLTMTSYRVATKLRNKALIST